MVLCWRYYDALLRRSPFHHLQLTVLAVTAAAKQQPRQESPRLKLNVRQNKERLMFVKFKKVLTWIRDVWLIFGIIIAYLLLIEIVLSIAFHYRDASSNGNPVNDSSVYADTYQNADWPKKYYKEFNETGDSEWLSYVYWRRKPYQGQYINIDSQGIRKTWSSNIGGGDKSIHPTIFLFGGSSMWGTGSRDDFTIPSIFSERLATNGVNAQIVNFGESGYVRTQEVILLIRELQKMNIPDLVIFYDGVNDTYSAYQQQIAGIPQNEFNRVKEFKSSKRITTTGLWSSFANNLSTIRFAKDVFRRLGTGSPSDNTAQHNTQNSLSKSFTNNEALANDVLNIYEKNVEIVECLAKRYSFKALFYWQPTIFEKQCLTKYEEEERRRHLEMQLFFEMTYGLLKQRDISKDGEIGFHNLSMLFSNVSEPLFVDWNHLGETGNRYIAERLVLDTISIMGGRLSAEQGAAPDRLSAPLQSDK